MSHHVIERNTKPVELIPAHGAALIPLALTELAERVASELGRHYEDMERIQQDIAVRREQGASAAAVEIIGDVAAVRERIDELSFFARTSIHALQPRSTSAGAARKAADRPDSRSLRRGLDIRVVTDAGRPGSRDALTVRTSAQPLPCRLIIIDAEVAVTTIEASERPGAAMVVREPVLVRALQCLFDTVWSGAAPTEVSDAPTADERVLLELLLAGGTDESIGRALGLCDRQVRRRNARLLERLGAPNRFAAGAAAARRGWL